MSALELGPHVLVEKQDTGLPGPFALLEGVPVFDPALPQCFSLAAIPLIAILVVLGWDKARTMPLIAPACYAAALLPLLPAPLPVQDRPPIPHFYTSGHWQTCAKTGDVILAVPPAAPGTPEPMRHAAAARAAFGLTEGFFIGSVNVGLQDMLDSDIYHCEPSGNPRQLGVRRRTH